MIKTPVFTTIYLVRHGEVEWNVKKLVLGQTDLALTEKGIKQAEKLKNKLRSIKFDAIFSSDLVRAKKTAEIIALERNLTVQTRKALREQSFGKYQGWERGAFLKLFDKWNEMTNEERHKYTLSDDMESNEQALIRLLTFLGEVKISHKGQTVLVVTHGALMRYLLIHLGHSSYDYISYFNNTGYIKLESDGVNYFIKELKGFHKL